MLGALDAGVVSCEMFLCIVGGGVLEKVMGGCMFSVQGSFVPVSIVSVENMLIQVMK